MTIEIAYGNGATRPCPNPDFPLHHFACSQTDPDDYKFICTAPECRAGLSIVYNPPVVSDDDLELLTNVDALQRRYEAAVARDSTRAGIKLASPATTLWKLRRYIRDALKPENAGKKIPAINKRFLESFGDDCNDLFARLGFKYVVSSDGSILHVAMLTQYRSKMRKRPGIFLKLHHTPTG